MQFFGRVSELANSLEWAVLQLGPAMADPGGLAVQRGGPLQGIRAPKRPTSQTGRARAHLPAGAWTLGSHRPLHPNVEPAHGSRESSQQGGR